MAQADGAGKTVKTPVDPNAPGSVGSLVAGVNALKPPSTQGAGSLVSGAKATAAAATAPPPAPPKASTAPGGGTGTAATSTTTDPASLAIAAWVDTLYEQYVGHPATAADLAFVRDQGWTPDRLRQHLRGQPSYVPGMTMGQYEDTKAASHAEYLKYLGYEPSDSDIRDLAQRGIRDQFAVNNYLKNRPDVVALHPGAPIDLADDQYGHWKDQVNAHYSTNLKREATDAEARDAYNNRQTVAPTTETSITPQLTQSSATGGLQAKDILSPTARAMG